MDTCFHRYDEKHLISDFVGFRFAKPTYGTRRR